MAICSAGWHMQRNEPWDRAVSAVNLALSAIASRAGIQPKSAMATSGPAPITEMQRKSAEALLLTSLECRIAELNRLKPNDPRRGQLAKAIYSARHDILFGGRR